MKTAAQRDQLLLDRRDLRRALIERRNNSKSYTRRAGLEKMISFVEGQIAALMAMKVAA